MALSGSGIAVFGGRSNSGGALEPLRLATQGQHDADDMLDVLDPQANIHRALLAALDAQSDRAAVVSDFALHIKDDRRLERSFGLLRDHEILLYNDRGLIS